MFSIDFVRKFVDEFFSIDCGFLDGLVVTELCSFYLFLWLRSTATGFIITFTFVDNWMLFPFYPVVNSFDPFITYAGLSTDELMFFLIVVSKFFIPCSFLNFYLCSYFFAYYCSFTSNYFLFFWLFYCAFFPWKELFKESHIEFNEVLWA